MVIDLLSDVDFTTSFIAPQTFSSTSGLLTISLTPSKIQALSINGTKPLKPEGGSRRRKRSDRNCRLKLLIPLESITGQRSNLACEKGQPVIGCPFRYVRPAWRGDPERDSQAPEHKQCPSGFLLGSERAYVRWCMRMEASCLLLLE
ncbi:hypothetical protein A8990_11236 [Paenibacillus taihuensis]|uniref:Uncharacterized protein n=1 Tax=Paenibacillus taihuensis TaxID=1156355 RepID=A0A3D9S9Z2_9BACL|nr:hypothetical protein A8990_11236 [Paenibacillus taihuensis]